MCRRDGYPGLVHNPVVDSLQPVIEPPNQLAAQIQRFRRIDIGSGGRMPESSQVHLEERYVGTCLKQRGRLFSREKPVTPPLNDEYRHVQFGRIQNDGSPIKAAGVASARVLGITAKQLPGP